MQVEARSSDAAGPQAWGVPLVSGSHGNACPAFTGCVAPSESRWPLRLLGSGHKAECNGPDSRHVVCQAIGVIPPASIRV